MNIQKIISGGQTGADRAALDFALERGVEYGGFVPLGRRAEDGIIPAKYASLTETETSNYAERTELNILNSDATIIVSHGKLTGGSLLTERLAKRHRKPCLHIDFASYEPKAAALKAGDFLRLVEGRVLNMAGPRASGDPEIVVKTVEFLTCLFD